MQKTTIISCSLHHIDVLGNTLNPININLEGTDLSQYLDDLLFEVSEKPQKRQYNFARETTEFFRFTLSAFSSKDLTANNIDLSLAQRLLAEEVKADKKYGHLGSEGKGHVKKGSFLQFLYNENSQLFYLGVKIEHQSFIDEDDLKKKIGLAIANKIYKAVRVMESNSLISELVHVYDTNSKPSVYWWSDFLELTELRSDEYNTRTASEEVIKTIGLLKKPFPSDYYALRNAAIVAFKQKGEFDYTEFVNGTFGSYKSDQENFDLKLEKVIANLHKLPETKGFDTKFNSVPSEVKFKRTNIKLSQEISVSYDEDIKDLDEKIWSIVDKHGRKLVVIHSDEGYENFKTKDND